MLQVTLDCPSQKGFQGTLTVTTLAEAPSSANRTYRGQEVPNVFSVRDIEGFLIKIAGRWHRVTRSPTLPPEGPSGPVWQVTYGRDNPKFHLWLVLL